MNISGIVKEYMEKNGYTGLDGGECGCHINNLFSCGYISDCDVGYANECSTCAKCETCTDGRRAKAEGYDFLCLPMKCYEAEAALRGEKNNA